MTDQIAGILRRGRWERENALRTRQQFAAEDEGCPNTLPNVTEEAKELRIVIWCLAQQAFPEPLRVTHKAFDGVDDHSALIVTTDPRTRETLITIEVKGDNA